VYVVAVLGVWHFYWQVKKDVREPLIYCALLAMLLAWRLFKNRARANHARAPARRAEQPTLKF
jgi:sulfoxide reductase heme-binding subunit YedZ